MSKTIYEATNKQELRSAVKEVCMQVFAEYGGPAANAMIALERRQAIERALPDVPKVPRVVRIECAQIPGHRRVLYRIADGVVQMNERGHWTKSMYTVEDLKTFGSLAANPNQDAE